MIQLLGNPIKWPGALDAQRRSLKPPGHTADSGFHYGIHSCPDAFQGLGELTPRDDRLPFVESPIPELRTTLPP